MSVRRALEVTIEGDDLRIRALWKPTGDRQSGDNRGLNWARTA